MIKEVKMKLTRLYKKDFEKILRNYNIGKYKSDEHLPFAIGNTVHIVNYHGLKPIASLKRKN